MKAILKAVKKYRIIGAAKSLNIRQSLKSKRNFSDKIARKAGNQMAKKKNPVAEKLGEYLGMAIVVGSIILLLALIARAVIWLLGL